MAEYMSLILGAKTTAFASRRSKSLAKKLKSGIVREEFQSEHVDDGGLSPGCRTRRPDRPGCIRGILR